MHRHMRLDRSEIAPIASREHVPEVAASALANYLLHHEGDAPEIRQMLAADLHAAIEDGRLQHASELFMALREFLEETRSVH
jgi:hypothetical protein